MTDYSLQNAQQHTFSRNQVFVNVLTSFAERANFISPETEFLAREGLPNIYGPR